MTKRNTYKTTTDKLPAWYIALTIFTGVLFTALFLAPIWMPTVGIK